MTRTFDIRLTDCESPCLPEKLQRRMFMKMARLIVLSAALLSASCIAHAQGKSAPKDAVLYFIWPHDGATIKGAFWCRFGLRNMGVTHAATIFRTPAITIC